MTFIESYETGEVGFFVPMPLIRQSGESQADGASCCLFKSFQRRFRKAARTADPILTGLGSNARYLLALSVKKLPVAIL
jgi:hypothetical protein